jgi:hypothetical protein
MEDLDDEQNIERLLGDFDIDANRSEIRKSTFSSLLEDQVNDAAFTVDPNEESDIIGSDKVNGISTTTKSVPDEEEVDLKIFQLMDSVIRRDVICFDDLEDNIVISAASKDANLKLDINILKKWELDMQIECGREDS